jgi:catechol 2,3-dioxygenase-like lactoylglutathione lyase family enzyme
MSDSTSTTNITAVGTVFVPVTDQDRALAFYTETLGFQTHTDLPYGEGDRWVEVVPPGAETTLAIVPPRPGDPVGVDLGFGLSSSNVDADHAELERRGVEVEELMRMGDPVPPMFFFRDPDGNRLMVVQRAGS